MTRAQKVAKAQELRAKGLNNREIGERLGVTHSCVTKWLNPEAQEWSRRSNEKRHEAKKAWQREKDREDRAICPICGGPMGIGSGRASRNPNPTRPWNECSRCKDKRIAARDRELEGLWSDGLSMFEIADHFGWQKSNLGREMFFARARGADLPYRHQGDRKGTGVPELRRAA